MKNLISTFVFGALFSIPAMSAESVAPKVIYHFGHKAHLIQDAEAGNIPENIWDDSIMGEKTKYKLLPFRRGLYGTTHPAYAETFGNWMMEVTIKDECRSADRTAVPSDFLTNDKFKKWFPKQSEFKTIQAFQSKCYVKTSESSLLAPRFVAKLQNVHATKEGACERVVEKFLTDEKIALVLDEQWVDQEHVEYNIDAKLSWYVRDRNCIERIRGKPEDMVSIMNDVPLMWKYIPTQNGVAPLGVAKAPEFQSNGIAEISDALQSDRAKVAVRILIDVLSGDSTPKSDLLKLKKESIGSDVYWVYLTSEKIGVDNLVPRLAEAKLRCGKRGQPDLFRKALERFSTDEERSMESATMKTMEQYAFSVAAKQLSSSLVQICR